MQARNNDGVGVQYAGDLPLMVTINEDIKAVMRTANEINLAALNAMLIANKAGKASTGFSVVSSELRAFSMRLSDAMRILSMHVSELVREMAGMIRLNKLMQLQLATRAGTAHYAHWDAMMAHKSFELAQNQESILQYREKLALALGRTNKLCIMGQSLSYSAKIEAVYGGEQAGALKHVSEGVEASIVDILTTLKKLDGQLEVMA